MTSTIEPYKYCFISRNNPVIFELKADDENMVIVTISIGGDSYGLSVYPYYSGGEYYIHFEVSDILQGYSEDVFLESGVVSAGSLIQYTVTCSDYNYTGYAIPGGISKFIRRYLNQRGVNIFENRFLDPTKQFLFTTRTNDSIITLCRQEIRSIYYLSPVNENIIIQSDKGNSYTIPGHAIGTPVHVNLKYILESFPNSINIKTLKFIRNSSEIFHIKIKDSVSEESYLVKFRNSLNVFEWIEFRGRAFWSPSIASDTTYNRYNQTIQNLEKATEREIATDYLDIETGYKTTDELRYLNDLLTSNERYLIIGNYNIPVIATATPEYAARKVSPESVVIRLEFVDSDSNFSPQDFTQLIDKILLTNNRKNLVTNTNKTMIVN